MKPSRMLVVLIAFFTIVLTAICAGNMFVLVRAIDSLSASISHGTSDMLANSIGLGVEEDSGDGYTAESNSAEEGYEETVGLYSDDGYDDYDEDAGEWAEEYDPDSEEYNGSAIESYDNIPESDYVDEQSGDDSEIAAYKGQGNAPVDETSSDAYDIPNDPPEYSEVPEKTDINHEESDDNSVLPDSVEDDYGQSDIDSLSIDDTTVQEYSPEPSTDLNETSSSDEYDHEVPTDSLPVETFSEGEGLPGHDGLVDSSFVDDDSVTPDSVEGDYDRPDVDSLSIDDTTVQEDSPEPSTDLNETSSSDEDDHEVPTDSLPVETFSEGEDHPGHDDLPLKDGFLDAEDHGSAYAMQILSESTAQSGVLVPSGDHFEIVVGAGKEQSVTFDCKKLSDYRDLSFSLCVEGGGTGNTEVFIVAAVDTPNEDSVLFQSDSCSTPQALRVDTGQSPVFTMHITNRSDCDIKVLLSDLTVAQN